MRRPLRATRVLRRTADDYLEIIEIKTPFMQPLFRYDASHDRYAVSKPLADAIGQVIRTLRRPSDRDHVIAHHEGATP